MDFGKRITVLYFVEARLIAPLRIKIQIQNLEETKTKSISPTAQTHPLSLLNFVLQFASEP